jgi:GTP cyclohydrolase IA
MNKEEEALKIFLSFLGEDVNSQDLLKTPSRMLEGYKNILSGNNIKHNILLDNNLIKVIGNDIICFDEIDFFSLCKHHFLPFFGTLKIAYIPNEFGVGFNTILRIVEGATRRLQLQEDIIKEIGNALQESILNPLGIYVEIRAKHFCVLAKNSNSSKPFNVKNVYTTKAFKEAINIQKLNAILQK